MSSERPLTSVPVAILAALALTLSGHVALQSARPLQQAAATDIGPPPGETVTRLAALGDPLPAARILMLYLQSFDLRADNPVNFRSLDYQRVVRWLGLMLELDPRGQYPLHAASRIYADTDDRDRQRLMLEFIHRQFFADPQRRWPWLAEGAAMAKHRLGDLDLARRYASAIQQHATGPGVPLWARQMEAFILEDMNELESARIMIGSFVASGQVTEPGELRFLEGRLAEIERRLQGKTSYRKRDRTIDMPSAFRQ